MWRSTLSFGFLALTLALVGCAAPKATPTSTFASTLPEAIVTPTPSATLPASPATPLLIPPSATRTPFPQPRIRVSSDFGIIAQYDYAANDLAVSVTGQSIVWSWQDWSGEKQSTVYPGLIFLPTSDLLRTRHLDANQPIAVAVESKRERVVTGSVDGAIEIWNAGTGMQDFVFGTVPGKPTSIALNADDSLIAVGANGRYAGGDGSVTIWKKDGTEPLTVLPAYGAVTRVEFVPDFDTLYFSTHASSCSRGGGAVFRWAGEGTGAEQVFSAAGNPVLDFAIHPQGGLIAAVGQTGESRCLGPTEVSIFDVTSGKVAQVLSHTGQVDYMPPITDVASVTFSPDGRYLAVGDALGNLHVWEWEAGELLVTLEFGSSFISRVHWTAQNVLVLNDSDGYVRLLRAPVP